MIGHKLGEPGGNCTVTGSAGEGYIYRPYAASKSWVFRPWMDLGGRCAITACVRLLNIAEWYKALLNITGC
jgi:hypothetical protein